MLNRELPWHRVHMRMLVPLFWRDIRHSHGRFGSRQHASPTHSPAILNPPSPPNTTSELLAEMSDTQHPPRRLEPAPPGDSSASRIAQPSHDAGRALLRSVTECHFLDVGLNCRGAYRMSPARASGGGLRWEGPMHVSFRMIGTFPVQARDPWRSLPDPCSFYPLETQALSLDSTGLTFLGACAVTDPSIIDDIARARGGPKGGFSVHLHGTPRQWGPQARPWIRLEKDRMVQMMM